MMPRRRSVLVVAVLTAILSSLPAGLSGRPQASPTQGTADGLPSRLTDWDFWALATDLSEPDGSFHSENLVSNETLYQIVIPTLARSPRAGAYLGVGSEQNLTYIAAVQPPMAFIVDIRRGNLDLHLVYKALFELSANRVEFISRLFSRAAPADLAPSPTVSAMFDAVAKVPASEALFDQNLSAIKATLITKHGLPLSEGDLQGIEFVYRSWFTGGPGVHYQLTTGPGVTLEGFPTYADLMKADDGAGQNRSYLATDEAFAFLKAMHARNLIVPVVGNFAGRKALRAVGDYLRQRRSTVSVFYVSNVESYLRQDRIWGDFCANVATLPLDDTSTFIRSVRAGFAVHRFAPWLDYVSELTPIKPEVANCPPVPVATGAGR